MQFQREPDGSHNSVTLKDKDEESFFFTVCKLCLDTALADASYPRQLHIENVRQRQKNGEAERQ